MSHSPRICYISPPPLHILVHWLADALIVDAALVQTGAVMARNLEELLDVLIGFTCPVLPRGSRLGMLVVALWLAVISAEALGFELPELSTEAQQEPARHTQGYHTSLR